MLRFIRTFLSGTKLEGCSSSAGLSRVRSRFSRSLFVPPRSQTRGFFPSLLALGLLSFFLSFSFIRRANRCRFSNKVSSSNSPSFPDFGDGGASMSFPVSFFTVTKVTTYYFFKKKESKLFLSQLGPSVENLLHSVEKL